MSQMLAKAWRELAGLHPDMVVTCPRIDEREWRVSQLPYRKVDGNAKEPVSLDDPVEMHDRCGRWALSRVSLLLPVVDSPANLGRWMTWAMDRSACVEVERAYDTEGGHDAWDVTVGYACSYGDTRLSAALLGALCFGWEHVFGEELPMPAAVTDWWKAEGQGDVRNG